MIHLFDAMILARTKLKSHKVRTGLTIAISGLLFSVLLTIIVVSQGVFTSVDNFSQEGLNSRAIVAISHSPRGLNAFDFVDNAEVIAEVERVYNERIATKKALAKKYGVEFDPNTEDPTPIATYPDSKQKHLDYQNMHSSVDVMKVLEARDKAEPFDIDNFLSQYETAKVIQRVSNYVSQPVDGGVFKMMKDGKESEVDQKDASETEAPDNNNNVYYIQTLDGSLTRPFISTEFDSSKGEVPVVFPVSAAEKLLKLKKLDASASPEAKLERMKEIRSRVGELTIGFCYRNVTSEDLYNKAVEQSIEMKRRAGDSNYQKPSLIYNLPEDGSCGAVTIASDKRTAEEKKIEQNYNQYYKELGQDRPEPSQQKIVFRGVGISGDADTLSEAWSIQGVVASLLSSNLGYFTWSIPSDLLDKLPEDNPSRILVKQLSQGDENKFNPAMYAMGGTYVVEFSDKDEARQSLTKSSSDETFVMPFGSNVLLVDEAREWLDKAAKWIFLTVGIIASIILAGIIGRTVADGRRESAVFRAVGASRGDIASIYGSYVLLLCARVVLSTALVGLGSALLVHLVYSKDATFGAQVAYAAADTNRQFNLFDLSSPYVLWIVATIFIAGLVASIIPIVLGARRSPMRDMRNE